MIHVHCLRHDFAALPIILQEDAGSVDPTKFVAKKSKAVAKKGLGNTQVRCWCRSLGQGCHKRCCWARHAVAVSGRSLLFCFVAIIMGAVGYP